MCVRACVCVCERVCERVLCVCCVRACVGLLWMWAHVCVCCVSVCALEAYRYALKVNMTNEEEGMSFYL